MILGIRKRKLADQLHDKVLYADAEMNRADWMTVAAAMLGVIGIGLGFWWADGVAALFIAQDIIRDGWRNVRAATHDLMDARPRRHDNTEYHPVVVEMEREAEKIPWVRDAGVRLREEGHVFTGEVVIVPEEEPVTADQLDEVAERCPRPGLEGPRRGGGSREGDRHPGARRSARTRCRSMTAPSRRPSATAA